MPKKYIKPIAGGQENGDVIVPGPIRGEVPDPTEIVCIEARKVFDFCFQEDLIERCFFLPQNNVEEILDCEIEQVKCREIRDREPVPGQEGLFLVTLSIQIRLRIGARRANGDEVDFFRDITFAKRVVLCAPEGTDVTCDVNGTCVCVLQEAIDPDETEGETSVNQQVNQNGAELCCTVQLCVVVQSTADVKLLVPAFGFCAPAECRVAPAFGGCPPVPPPQCIPPLDDDIDEEF